MRGVKSKAVDFKSYAVEADLGRLKRIRTL